MTIYPHRLLPKINNKIIQVDQTNSDSLWLARQVPTDILRSGDTLRAISQYSNHFFDLSVNLVGHFKKDDIKIVLQNRDSKKHLIQEWREFEFYRKPKPSEFYTDSNCSPIYFELEKVHGFPLKMAHPSIPDKSYDYLCRIIHKPTKCNFWHFQFEWRDRNTGKIVKPIEGKRPFPRSLLTDFKNMYRIHSKRNPGNMRSLNRLEFKHSTRKFLLKYFKFLFGLSSNKN